MSSRIVASVPLSAMLKVGKLIQPTVDIVSIQLEEFDLGERSWRHPFEARFLSRKKNSPGVEHLGTLTWQPLFVRSAYLATVLCKLGPGKFVLKNI